eukprot:TRINITY_DN1144_c0_g1_i10.p1 TRINITY_DN1144_c0_g1~~TRINITY_DN1144_c0_g1_i10.p1  ORF type:complete len:182 (+),score=30.63 TRINITY_DN1144_c0_g1_i10:21-566(+)
MEAVVSTQSTGELTSPVVAMSSTKDFSQLTPAERMKQKHNIQNSVRTGGKGSVRRKVKVQRRPQGTDDKKVIQALKGLGLNQVPGVDQVEMLRKDGTTLIFKNPKVQAAVNANTCVHNHLPSHFSVDTSFQDLLLNPKILFQSRPFPAHVRLKKVTTMFPILYPVETSTLRMWQRAQLNKG